MGNANGREEGGSGSQSGVEDGGGAQVSMADGDGAGGDYHAHGGDYMGQSPPSSPRASHSPLMFKPQMPVVPLQRPDELHIPSPSWMQTSSGCEDTYNEHGIPTIMTWSYGGKEVSVEGSWDNWKARKPLQKSGKDFTIMKVLPSGVYQYRFLVDGQHRHSPDQPWEHDESGNVYNILDLQMEKIFKFIQPERGFGCKRHPTGKEMVAKCTQDRAYRDYVPEDIDSISGFEPPQSPDSSYSNSLLGQEDFGKEPPMVPPHLNMTLLNAPSYQMEFPPPQSRPQHVVLNHLYMQRDRSHPSAVALGSTNRFLSKYVTVVLYKSVQR